MPFPLANEKAPTTYLDSDSDAIWQARAGIKKDFDNVNSIIDSFTLSSPTDQGVLGYNGSTFTTLFPAMDINMVYLTFTGFPVGVTDNGFANATILNPNNLTGITKTTIDSAGFTVLDFPAGTYYWQQPDPFQVNNSTDDLLFRVNTVGYDSAGALRGGFAPADNQYGDEDQVQVFTRGNTITDRIPGPTDITWVQYSGSQTQTAFVEGNFDSAGEDEELRFTNRDLWTFDQQTQMYLNCQVTKANPAVGYKQEHPDIIIRRIA